MKIKGINLGNWLVLEKWMQPEMFRDTDAEDEMFLCRELEETEKQRRYKEHRNTYITEQDFQNILSAGFNAVRIPVPYFLFEDIGPFIHCYEYLDRAFEWAEKYGLKILVDLHTVPGGQNGSDNSGICGVCTWSTKEEYLEMTLDVLEKIAQRYGKEEALWGIEAINEPMCSDAPIAGFMNVQMMSQIYHAAEPEMAKDNTNYPLSYLQDFYRRAYERMRKYLPVEKAVVFSDAFYLEGWDAFWEEKQFENIVLDTHQYVMMEEYSFGDDRPIEKYEEHLGELMQSLENIASKLPVIVGEWSLSNMMTGYEDAHENQKTRALQRLYQAYRRAVDTCDGWFYWSYKLQADEPEKKVWDMRKCLENGWVRM